MGFNIILTDTAGLRESEDLVEKEGISLAKEEAGKSDGVILVVDVSELEQRGNSLVLRDPELIDQISKVSRERLLVLLNKIDKRPIEGVTSVEFTH